MACVGTEQPVRLGNVDVLNWVLVAEGQRAAHMSASWRCRDRGF